MIYRPYLKIEFVIIKMVIFKINKCKNLFVYLIIFHSCLILLKFQWLCWAKIQRLPLEHHACSSNISDDCDPDTERYWYGKCVYCLLCTIF